MKGVEKTNHAGKDKVDKDDVHFGVVSDCTGVSSERRSYVVWLRSVRDSDMLKKMMNRRVRCQK